MLKLTYLKWTIFPALVVILISFLSISVTKDKDKLQNINDAVKIFEDWLSNFELQNRSKENRAYLPLASIEVLSPLKKKYEIEDEEAESFLKAYKKAGAEYKNLRTVSSGENKPTWDIVRNSKLKELLENFHSNSSEFWDGELPTKEHLHLILWAYSPEASKIKKNQSKFEDLLGTEDEESQDEEKEEENKSSNKKRKSEGSSSSEEEESPTKKTKADKNWYLAE